MERKNFLKSVTIAGFSGLALAACSIKRNDTDREDQSHVLQKGTILHSVYFWLKEDLTKAEEEDFLHFFEELRKTPGVQTLHFGKPAPTNPRPVVDNSFHYNLLVTFADMDAIHTYETHPLHTAAAEKYSKYWSKVEVRDTLI